MVKQYRIIVPARYLTEEILVIAKAGNAVFILSGWIHYVLTMCQWEQATSLAIPSHHRSTLIGSMREPVKRAGWKEGGKKDDDFYAAGIVTCSYT